jgi:hypothetical protein
MQYLGAQYINSTSGTSKLWSIISPQNTNSISLADNGSIQFYHASNDGLNTVYNWGTNESPGAQRNILINDPGTNVQPTFSDTGSYSTGSVPFFTKASGSGGRLTCNKNLAGGTKRQGTGALSSGSATISTTAYSASCIVLLTDLGGGTLANVGSLYVDTASSTPSTSFVVKSTSATDNNNFAWMIIEP